MVHSFLCVQFVYAFDYCWMITIVYLHGGKPGDVQKFSYRVCDYINKIIQVIFQAFLTF
jgi:hypothetical protein